MHDITEIQKLLDTKKLLTDRIANDNERLRKTIASISKICPHPSTIKKSSYSEGGYDYTSCSRTWDACTICDKMFNYKEVNGDFA